jgi:hypothetical protein
MIWGLVFGFMEGRRTSEVLGAILCASFILSSGVVKSVGKWLMVDLDVSPFWMPAATGAIFMPLLLCRSGRADADAAAQRPPTRPSAAYAPADGPGPGRIAFLPTTRRAALLVAVYVVLTALRDFRDNFAAEIWTALGFMARPPRSSPPANCRSRSSSLVVMGAVMLVRDNLRALLVMHGVIVAGLSAAGRFDPGVPGAPAGAADLDDPDRGGALHGLHAVQRHAVRPDDRLRAARSARPAS